MDSISEQKTSSSSTASVEKSELSEQVIAYYEGTILMLAYHLTDDEEISREVVAEVSDKLRGLLSVTLTEPVETLVHRFTYESAIAQLLDSVVQQGESAETFVKILAH